MNKNLNDDINSNKDIAFLSYLGLLVLVPLLARKESVYANFHVKEGLNLLLISTIANIAVNILCFPFYSSMFRYAIVSLVDCGVLILTVIGIVNALSGKMEELPVINKFKIIK